MSSSEAETGFLFRIKLNKAYRCKCQVAMCGEQMTYIFDHLFIIYEYM